MWFGIHSMSLTVAPPADRADLPLCVHSAALALVRCGYFPHAMRCDGRVSVRRGGRHRHSMLVILNTTPCCRVTAS